MGNLDLIKTSLQKYLGEDKIKKIATNRYLINSNIVFNSTFEFLPINLVEVNGIVYLADYGEIFKTFDKNFDTLEENQKQELNKLFLENDIIFDGQSVLKKVSDGREFVDYNIFVKLIIILEFFLERF